MTGRWFSQGPQVSSTNKTDRHDITEISLKVALKHHQTNKQTNQLIATTNIYSRMIEDQNVESQNKGLILKQIYCAILKWRKVQNHCQLLSKRVVPIFLYVSSFSFAL